MHSAKGQTLKIFKIVEENSEKVSVCASDEYKVDHSEKGKLVDITYWQSNNITVNVFCTLYQVPSLTRPKLREWLYLIRLRY